MIININYHYFSCYSGKSDLEKLGNYQVGEIITDWEGDTGCILMIMKDGSIRTDSNGIGDISKIKKVRSKKKILEYLQILHKSDMNSMLERQKTELGMIG